MLSLSPFLDRRGQSSGRLLTPMRSLALGLRFSLASTGATTAAKATAAASSRLNTRMMKARKRGVDRHTLDGMRSDLWKCGMWLWKHHSSADTLPFIAPHHWLRRQGAKGSAGTLRITCSTKDNFNYTQSFYFAANQAKAHQGEPNTDLERQHQLHCRSTVHVTCFPCA